MFRAVILILVLGWTSAQAATSNRLDSLRVHVYGRLNVPTTGTDGLTSATVDQLINYGIVEVCEQFPAIEKLDTIVVSKSSEGVALPSDCLDIRWAAQLLGDTLRVPMWPASLDTLRNKRGSSVDRNKMNENDSLDLPYYTVNNNRLHVHPKYLLEESTSILIAYYAVGAFLASSSDTTNVSAEYRDELVTWVCAKAAVVRGDLTRAAYFETLYDKSLKLYGRVR